ncbi:28S ribosomal protein S31, mitochondrial [Polistes fuscatus]|uniref:28S ribosomal protein S31, mitochondrial n=1 Tax=Polistes fuscatus TaxID=30207 RepID=UPI001CA88128|nr:28S ribosomal protein S31, mitochondrial [Polistes fuscatus]
MKQKETILEVDKSRRRIFNEIKEPTTTIPELSTWAFLEKRELDLIANHPPQNIFQEMIQWTESGKLWKFPIDNEIGMEKESNVHFTEHVFLERHLKDWCPTTGPIRHFMELVCVGLSKNPYMTVKEKTDHIEWYKEYFKGKKEILLELGAIQTTSDTTKQITS